MAECDNGMMARKKCSFWLEIHTELLLVQGRGFVLNAGIKPAGKKWAVTTERE